MKLLALWLLCFVAILLGLLLSMKQLSVHDNSNCLFFYALFCCFGKIGFDWKDCVWLIVFKLKLVNPLINCKILWVF